MKEKYRPFAFHYPFQPLFFHHHHIQQNSNYVNRHVDQVKT